MIIKKGTLILLVLMAVVIKAHAWQSNEELGVLAIGLVVSYTESSDNFTLKLQVRCRPLTISSLSKCSA